MPQKLVRDNTGACEWPRACGLKIILRSSSIQWYFCPKFLSNHCTTMEFILYILHILHGWNTTSDSCPFMYTYIHMGFYWKKEQVWIYRCSLIKINAYSKGIFNVQIFARFSISLIQLSATYVKIKTKTNARNFERWITS